MQFAKGKVSIAPIRVLPNHTTEMTSQLLYGERCVIIEANLKWVKICCKDDEYIGWCQKEHVEPIAEVEYNKTIDLNNKWAVKLQYENEILSVPLGALIDEVKNNIEKINEQAITKLAYEYLGTPYLWGGKSVFGVDCSGFVQMMYKFFGIFLKRDAQEQVLQGETVNFLQEAKCGDLAFFEDEQGKIVHVGLLLSTHQIIHASYQVKIDDIDNEGIIDSNTGERRQQKLRIIKRFF